VSYLLTYARRPHCAEGVRVDERVRLNRPEFDGGAEVRVFVEDTSAKEPTRHALPSPTLKLRISDCMNEINLEFAVESAALRDNSLFKIDTLVDALAGFREAFAAEAALYAVRERHRA